MGKKNSFRGKLLKFILILNLLSIFIVILYGNYYFQKKEETNNIIDLINKLNINLIMDIKSQSDFIKYDAVDTNYYIHLTSANLETHKRLSRNIDEILTSLNGKKYTRLLNLQNDIDSLSYMVNKINQEFDRIIVDIKLRGFKDFGVEGKMRMFAHMLENSDFNSTMILSLRRHEKDYILRKEPQYIIKLNKLGEKFKNDIAIRSDMESTHKDSITDILNNYLLEFNNLVKLEEKIGVYLNTGIMQTLEGLFSNSEIIIERINSNAYVEKDNMFRQLEINTIWFFLLLVLTNIIVSIYLSKYITNPLQILTGFISRVTESNFKISDFKGLNNSDNEIDILVSEFKNMLKQLRSREKERDNAEEALRDSEAKFKNLADLLPLSVFETDEECKLTYYNKSLANTLGYNNTSADVRLSLSEILKTDCDTLYETENSSGIDYVAYKISGEEIPVLLYANRIIKDNTYVGIRGILVDITEKKRYTEELKNQKIKAELADKLKSAFLANMSHEIRTPMNSIVGFSQLVAQPDVDNETRLVYADYIKNSSDLLLKIINDILDIAKIESGQLKITYSTFDLNNLMDKVAVQINEYKNILKKAPIEVRFKMQFERNEFFIYSDPFRLEQVLVNLLTNALKFTHSGSIEAGYNIEEKGKVKFYVKDTGIGIHHDKIDLIFERFTQLEDVNNKQYEGTGLGLSISKSILNLLGGRIWVESVPGTGSVFYFEIPLSENYSVKPNEYSIPAVTIENYSLKGQKLLIAEDVDYNFILLREALKSMEIEITRAYNGLEAVDILLNNPELSIVLMDMRMPVMDGYEATKIIKQMNREIKVIATTANALTGEREKCLKSGCDFYISKPINIELLIKNIGEIMNKPLNVLSIQTTT